MGKIFWTHTVFLAPKQHFPNLVYTQSTTKHECVSSCNGIGNIFRYAAIDAQEAGDHNGKHDQKYCFIFLSKPFQNLENFPWMLTCFDKKVENINRSL